MHFNNKATASLRYHFLHWASEQISFFRSLIIPLFNMSGTFHSKLFAAKRTKDSKPEESVMVRKTSIDSPGQDDSVSIPSSCAISLCDPDGNLSMESRSISNLSTRPSSTLSAAKKPRFWQKRISLGLQSPTESYCEDVAREVKPTVSVVSGTTAPVVTKHYSSHSVYKSSTNIADANGYGHVSATLPPQVPIVYENGTEKHDRDKTHKAAWKKLFGRKRKEKLRQNAEENGCTEETIMEQNDTEKPATEPETIITSIRPAVVTSVKSVGAGAEHVASRTGSEIIIYTDGPRLLSSDKSQTDGITSVDGVFFESEDEVFDRKSDSLEEFSFKFERDDQPVVRSTATLPQDVLCELRQMIPPPADDSNSFQRTEISKPKREFRERSVSDDQPDDRDPDEVNGKASVSTKPLPTHRAKKINSAEAKEAQEKPLSKPRSSTIQNDISALNHVESDGLQNGVYKAGKVVLNEKEGKNKMRKEPFLSMENGLDQREKIQKKPQFDRHLGAETMGKKLLERSGSADTLLETEGRSTNKHLGPVRRVSRDETSSNAKLTESKEYIGISNARKQETPHTSVPESRILTKVGTNAKSSKLRFPLRTGTGPRQANKQSTDSTTRTTQTRIPSQSTQSSRNKENKAAKSGDLYAENKSLKRKPAFSTTSTARRTSFRRHNSGRRAKQSAGKPDVVTPGRPPVRPFSPSRGKAIAGDSARLDFKRMVDLSHSYPYNTHHRSRSQDSIGNLAAFVNIDAERAESSKDSEEGKDWEGSQELLDGVVSPSPGNGDMDEYKRADSRKTGKQNCSSLINTPSGISVMEENDVPHRLPAPEVPLLVQIAEIPDPVWTRNCAALLNSHKWFNVHNDQDDNSPPELTGDLVSAVSGLRLIELRDLCGNVVRHWEFLDQDLPKTFHLSLPKPICEESQSTEIVVFAVDVFGNLMHRTIRLSSF